MKNGKIKFLITLLFVLILTSCGDEGPSVPNSPGNPLKGAFILYKGSTGNTDYAFYDASTGSVSNNVYASANSGRTLLLNPGEMRLNSNRDLYITAIEALGTPGTIYKINSENNQLTDSLTFGVNPYGFVINNNRIIAANVGSSYATLMDLDFNIIQDSISVGPSPTYIIYGAGKYTVSKLNVTTENSTAFVDESTNMVSKIFYTSPPVSTVFNVYGYFVSTYTAKKIYRIDSKQFQLSDSFTVPTSQPTIGELVFKTQSQFYIIASYREIWEVSVSLSGLSFRLLFEAVNDITINTVAYEQTKNEIYIGDANDYFTNGEIHILDAQTGVLKSSHALGGKSPVRIVFKY